MMPPTDKRVRLEQLLRAEAALKRLLEGTDDDTRTQAEIALVVVKAEIEIVKSEMAGENPH
jgi:hypothetical protein